jgi:hypothetical protein
MNKTLASTLVAAAAAIGSLLTSEIIKVGEKKEFSSDLHSHQEISANPVATTTNPYFVSGAQVDEGYRLHLNPVMNSGGNAVARIDLIALPTLGHTLLRGSFMSMDHLTDSLAAFLRLAPAQIQEIRNLISTGNRVEVGGFRAPLLFKDSVLRDLGMDERGPLLG